ncbi:MAG: OmpA family protein [Flavobacteriaceae bacterium]
MKIKIITGLFLLGIASGRAQELFVKLNGGLSGIQYDSPMGNGTMKFGGGAGLGYTHFLNDHWGLSTGVDVQYNGNEFKLNDDQKIPSYEIDDMGSAFEYRVASKRYKETQHFFSFAVPLMLQYRTEISNTKGLYLGLGGKFLIPSKLRTTASAEEIALSGYYPDLNLEFNDLPSHGYGTLTNWKEDTSVSLKTSVLLSMEGGLSFELKKGMQLYTGIYVDYGLTDLQNRDGSRNLATYNPEGIDMVRPNGVLLAESIVEGSNYLSAGVQVKLGFTLGRNKVPKEEAAIAQEPIVAEKEPIVAVAEEKPLIEETPRPYALSKEELAYVEEPLTFGSINLTTITPELRKRLDKIAGIVNKDNDLMLHIIGYTCDLGTTSINEKIGMERADSIAEYLKAQGVSGIRMKLYSKGETDPIVPNTSMGNRQKNRRVSIQLKEKQE